MKILKLPSYYAPEVVSSTHLTDDLEEAYAREGFTMELYAPTPTRGVSSAVRKKYKKIKYEEKQDGRIAIHRFSMMREGKNPMLRALRYYLVNVKQYRKAIRAKDVDVIMGSSTPPIQGLFCAKVARKLSKKYGRKVPFVYSLQDVFPDSLVSTGLAKKGSVIYKIGDKIANRIYDSADVIITIGEDIKRNIMAKGVPEEKIRVIPNWIDPDAVCPVAKADNKIFSELGLDENKFRIVYAGNLGMAQGVDVLLDAAERFADNDDIEFVVFGKGAREEQLKKRAEKMKNVKFFSLMPPERIAEVYSLGDACVVLCKKGTGGAGVPSKTWSIMACGTPLLVSFDAGSELCRVIESTGAGLCSEAGDANALAANITKLYESAESRAEMGTNARAYAEGVVSKKICVGKYVELLKSLNK